MARFFRKRDEARGQVPGSLIFIGKQKVDHTSIHVMAYDVDRVKEFDVPSNSIDSLQTEAGCNWINIYGLHEVDVIKALGVRFDVHPLVLEDVLNTGQRPKFEEFDEELFLVLSMFRYDSVEEVVHAEQLGMVIGNGFVITFQEQPGDVFEPVRERIRKAKGRIRTLGADYLAYALLDTIVDNYIHVIERLGERVEELDEDVLDEPDREILGRISRAKRELNYMRKSIRPAREALLQLSKVESDRITEDIVPFLKDLQDLVTHATEAIETYREMLSDQLNIYHSSLGNRMNDVMRVLTIFAAIFIPLTFIAGIYGMNFEYFPELHYRYSYFVFWGVIVAIGGGMLLYFRKKGWL